MGRHLMREYDNDWTLATILFGAGTSDKIPSLRLPQLRHLLRGIEEETDFDCFKLILDTVLKAVKPQTARYVLDRESKRRRRNNLLADRRGTDFYGGLDVDGDQAMQLYKLLWE